MIALLKTWWKNHKTKTLGLIQVVGGSIILYQDQLEHVLSRKAYGIIIVTAGVLTGILGWLNGKQNAQPTT